MSFGYFLTFIFYKGNVVMEKTFSYTGKQVIFDVVLKEQVEIDFLVKEMANSIKKAGMTIVDLMHKRFEPQGDTVVFILSESSMQLHSYPEHRYYSFDIYTCGDANPEISIDYLKTVLDVEKILVERTVTRGAA